MSPVFGRASSDTIDLGENSLNGQKTFTGNSVVSVKSVAGLSAELKNDTITDDEYIKDKLFYLNISI